MVRNKGNGSIKVIAVSKIFNKIIQEFQNENLSPLGINTDLADSGSTRSKFFKINVNAYSEDKQPWQRSGEA